MKTNVVIVGGGIGGLFTGAFLAKNGFKVTILEKNGIIGGGLQCFKRGGKIYETGMHIMGGFEEGGNLYKICKYLGVFDKLKLHHINSCCMDEIYFDKTKETFRIASGKEEFITCITNYFPEEANGIRDYVNALYDFTESSTLFNLRNSSNEMVVIPQEMLWPVDKFIAHYVHNEKLKAILAYLNPLYGGIQGKTPAYIHAFINVLYINGASRFIDGSQQLADALSEVILENGGAVLPNSEVTHIEVEDKQVKYVQTASNKYLAEWFVSSIHPVRLCQIVSENAFRSSFIERINEIQNTYSAFLLFVDFKPNKFPYIDHTCYYEEDYSEMWKQDCYEPETWPHGFMYMTPPDLNQGKYASRLLVDCVMSFDLVRPWENTSVNKRGSDYTEWKEQIIKKILQKLESMFPGFSEMVNSVYAASPLTIRDYYHTKEGSIFGYRKDWDNLMKSHFSVYTKVKNLLLTGQNVNLHGICGTPLTAIKTAEAIMGTNELIKP